MTEPSDRRRRTMRAVKGRDTETEMAVRRLVHSLGFRYRLHRRDLPGTPDLVFPARRAVVFVHGCFWHQHRCPRGSRLPKTRRDYWEPKLRRNQDRDRRNQRLLRKMGWRVLVVWECQITDDRRLATTLQRFLTPGGSKNGCSRKP